MNEHSGGRGITKAFLKCPECGGSNIIEAATMLYRLKINQFEMVDYELILGATTSKYYCEDCNHMEESLRKFSVGVIL